jgi:O-antigen/teichoic acid export membrane protein
MPSALQPSSGGDGGAVPAATDAVDVLDAAEAGGRAIRGGLVRTLAQLLSITLSVVSVPFMIRQLGDVDFGRYMTVQSILFILGGATEAGLTQLGIKRYGAMGSEERHGFLRGLVGLRLVLTTVGVLVAIGFSAVTGQPGVVVAGTAICGLGLALTLTQQTYIVSLTTELRFGLIAGLELIGQATLAVLTIALVIAGASLLPFFWAIVGSGVVLAIATWLALRRRGNLWPSYDPQLWRSVMAEVLPFALAAAVGLIYFRLAVVMMSYIASPDETGIYSAGQRVVEVAASLPWMVVLAAFPILARAAGSDVHRLRYALQRLFDVSVLLGGAFVAVGVSGASFAIAVVAGPEFDQSVGVLQILVVSLLMTFLVATWSSALLSLNQYRKILWANLAALLTTAILCPLLIGPLGPEGAAIATLAAETVLALAYLIALARTDRSLVPRFGAVARLAPGAAAAAAFGLLASLPSVVEAIACGGIYVAGAFALKAVPPEAIDALLRRPVAPSTD